MTTVEGKGGIKATVVADSISEAGVRITTFELEYQRFIHAEFMTHRQFSRNAASSRAIPIEKVIEQVETSPAMPIHWGKNQPGMQAKEEVGLSGSSWSPDRLWKGAANDAVSSAYDMSDPACGLHKQVVNRILEPYQMIKVVCTATEYENFFYLRDHPDAQPEIAELARCMKEARNKSEPHLLKPGEWHLPYVHRDSEGYWTTQNGMYYTENMSRFVKLSDEDAIKISASLCAQVSYRKADESLEKALKIYDQLVTMKPVHASPMEHQCTPMPPIEHLDKMCYTQWPEGVTHKDKFGNYWSGNFRGFVQNRQLIEGNVKYGDSRDS